jgi:hypothetical protein
VSLSYVGSGGEQERSPSGALAGGPTVLKREWRMTTTPIPASELDAWVGLIEGKGHYWPFDADLYSTRGRPQSAGTATIVTSSPTPKWGAGLARLPAASTLTFATQLPSSPAAWTTLHWRYDTSIPGWRHIVNRSDGARWLTGVRNDAITGGLSVSSGSVVLSSYSGLTDFDGLVAMPYAVPDSWPPLFYTQHNSAAWSALPRVLAAGSFASSSVTVRGEVTGTKVVRGSNAGALTTLYTLEFTLREV